MKYIRNFYMFALAGMLLMTSCTKEELLPLPGWEDGVTANGTLATGFNSFKLGDMDASLVKLDISWNNYGKNVVINKIEPYISFTETYYDVVKESDVSVTHLNAFGLNDPTLNVSNPENRKVYTINITPAIVYNLFKAATRKYNGTAAVNVFDNPERPDRKVAKTRFIKSDNFTVRLKLYALDGRVFDSWSASIQNGELVGASTKATWTVK
jgi:hypothetical protein